MAEKSTIVGRLSTADIPAALAIQSQAYPPALLEDEAVFLNRSTMPGSCCLSARCEGKLVGYLLCFSWPAQEPPALGEILRGDSSGEVLFIHDLAVSPAGRGKGIGQLLLERAFMAAARSGLREAQLIAVEGAHDYWHHLGFREQPASAAIKAKLRNYGPAARWMTRAIPCD